jgi:photosystem II stability/assembly factor-like uncharacterized protein
MSFVANDGQFDDEVIYSARGGGYQLFLTGTGATLALDGIKERTTDRRNRATTRGMVDDLPARVSSAVLRMKLSGARRAARVSGEGQSDGRVNYLIGDDPAKWRTNVATYSAVRYAEVYPGVDLVYYGSQQQLEYDFHIAPHADPRQIKIRFEGATEVKIDADGQLLLRAGANFVTQRKPVVYQLIGGARHEVAGRYAVNARREVGFKLGAYDHSLPLVIDPVLSYATYLGGSSTDQANGVAIDSAGNAYIVGQTNSTNFPVAGALQPTRGGTFRDVFVTKLNPTGTALVYSTYLGGSSSELGYGIAVDSAGNAYVTGYTFSADFPHTAGAYQQSKVGDNDAFVAKLNASGNALVYSTFLGGNNTEAGYGIGVDAAGNAYVAGATYSNVFNGTPAPKRGSPAYRSTDAGGSWSANNGGLPDAVLNSVTVDPTNHNTLYASGSSVFKSTDGGSTWVATAPLPAAFPLNFAPYPLSVTVDPVAPSTLYVASPFGVFKSTDAGGSWTVIVAGLEEVAGDVNQVLVDPTNHTTLYAPSLFGGVFKSIDAGSTWKNAYTGMSTYTPVTMLAIDPTNSNTLYAATYDGFYKSINGAAGWSRANVGLPSSEPGNPQGVTSIDAVVVDPLAPSTVYAYTSYDGVYKSTNGASSWSASSNGLPLPTDTVKHIAIDPLTPSTLYAAASFGIYKTTDGGAHWSPSNNGLANRFVNGVTVDPTTPARVYVAADSGRDAFIAKLNQSGTSLGYLQYLGGDEDDYAAAIAVDAAGDAHIAGTTYSMNFPVTNPLQSASGGRSDAFIAQLSPAGSVAYSTYLGGSGYDTGEGIALDGSGRAYVAGSTSSPNFPVTVTRKQPDPAGNDQFSTDVFLTRLAPNASSLDYSFIYGGTDYDEGIAVAADAAGNAYVTGANGSFDFPLFAPAQGAQGNAFALKFDPAGNIVYSTLFGGGGNSAGLAIAADNNGAAYIVGRTDALNFPVSATAFQRTRGGGTDGFAIKFQSSTDSAPQVQFSQSNYQDSESAGRGTLIVTRTGDVSSPLSVSYQTVDDPAAVRCDDTVNNHGAAYARCDYSTTLDTVSFAANDTTPKQITVPLIDDAHVEGNETVQVRLFNPINATLGAQSTATLTILDNDVAGEPNPILQTPLFVRMQYLDFLSREPEAGEPWSATLNNCVAGDTSCDRISVSANFFRSQEFQLKGLFVFRFYKVAFGRLPLYSEIVADMRSVTGTTTAELQAKKATFTNNFAQRQEFKNLYGAMTNQQFVDALMNRYGLQQVITPDPNNPDSGSKTSFTRAGFVAALNTATLSRAQVVRAIADSDEVGAVEFNPAFVAMQYFGYLRRDPEPQGYAAWLATINANPSDFRSMVNGFMNSQEYRLRFGQP